RGPEKHTAIARVHIWSDTPAGRGQFRAPTQRCDRVSGRHVHQNPGPDRTRYRNALLLLAVPHSGNVEAQPQKAGPQDVVHHAAACAQAVTNVLTEALL